MSASVRHLWNAFWFHPSGRRGIVVARLLLSLQALWIVLSRPDLPGVLAWPRAFWSRVDPAVLTRFLIFPIPIGVERGLYVVLIGALLATAFGFRTRVSAFASAILLYHFAPFEDVFSSQGGPFFRGLTLAVSGLFILSFAAPPRREESVSPEYTWPLQLIRLLFAFTYLFSGIAKLLSVGPVWATASNFQGLVLGLCFPTVKPPWADVFLDHPALCALGAVGGVLMDFGTIAAVFSRRAAWIVVPALLVAHLVVVKAMGVLFFGAPLALLFLPWEAPGKIRPRE